jgi:hippurate hydrolase
MQTKTTLVSATLLAAGALLGWLVVPGQPVSSLRAGEKADADLAKKVAKLVDGDEGRLVKFFKHLHANPELSFQETKTAALVAQELKGLGYETHMGIGKTGVVGILKNGPGPVVMFRGDMDGLPIRETTGLPFASKATAPTENGGFVPVMHACGHDAHVTFLIGVAKVMKELKGEWSGTLVLVAQPAEEVGLGANAMVRDGLYDTVPKPDVLFASHVVPIHPAGTASVKAGKRMAGTDQMDVIIHGIGGHGSAPQYAKDPVVMGSMAVLSYQTLISRTMDPQEPAVITVGAFQAGDVNNVIPDSATLKVNLRWFNLKVREQMIEGIKRITDAIAFASDMPKDRMPKYIMKGTAGPVVNDEEAARRAEPALRLALGTDKILSGPPPVMGSEDFQNLAAPHPTTKILFVMIGCGPAGVVENMAKGIMPAANHNPNFKVELPAIAAGTKADAMVLLEFLRRN